MPHQCLHCGEVFDVLTEEILFHGCSKCGGKKFTLTNKPMTDEERRELLEKREAGIRELIRRSREGELPRVEKIEKALEKDEKAWVSISPEEAPEVIKIVESGIYEINVDKLLKDSPIIINEDGSYIVYLPSLFKKRR